MLEEPQGVCKGSHVGPSQGFSRQAGVGGGWEGGGRGAEGGSSTNVFARGALPPVCMRMCVKARQYVKQVLEHFLASVTPRLSTGTICAQIHEYSAACLEGLQGDMHGAGPMGLALSKAWGYA